jgi:comEA protein
VGRESGEGAGSEADWTRGPAKWGAVVVLGAASIWGMVWSMGRVPRAEAVPGLRAPAGIGASEEVIGAGTASAEGDSAQSASAVPSAEASAETLATRININTALKAELELLPGIGPALAGRIIEYRQQRGPFKSVDDLDGVKGIGPKVLGKLRERVVVE